MRHILLLTIAFLSVFSRGNAIAQTPEPEVAAEPSRARLALRVLSRRAAWGDGEALYRLAYVHDTGYDSIPVDTLESTRLYRLSAEAGYTPAQNYLGFRLIRGEGVPADPAGGLAWIEKAALAGDVKAANNLGALLAEGKIVEPDRDKALFWFGRAADAGLPSAMAQLADLLSDPEAPDADFPLAARLYMEAARNGLPDARTKLAAMLNRNAPTVASAATLLGDRALVGEVYRTLADGYSLASGLPYSYEQSLRDYYIASLLGDEPSILAIEELTGLLPDALGTLDLETIDSDVREALDNLSRDTQSDSPDQN